MAQRHVYAMPKTMGNGSDGQLFHSYLSSSSLSSTVAAKSFHNTLSLCISFCPSACLYTCFPICLTLSSTVKCQETLVTNKFANYSIFVTLFLLGFLSVLLSCVIFIHLVLFVSGLHNPIDTLYHVQPLMTLALMPLAFLIEGIYQLCVQTQQVNITFRAL